MNNVQYDRHWHGRQHKKEDKLTYANDFWPSTPESTKDFKPLIVEKTREQEMTFTMLCVRIGLNPDKPDGSKQRKLRRDLDTMVKAGELRSTFRIGGEMRYSLLSRQTTHIVDDS
jgi:hypothetical protein